MNRPTISSVSSARSSPQHQQSTQTQRLQNGEANMTDSRLDTSAASAQSAAVDLNAPKEMTAMPRKMKLGG